MSNIIENKDRCYISYFQSVLTIGIMTRAKNKIEAESKAKVKINDKNGVNYCVFDQTPFEPTLTEPYKDINQDKEGIEFRFNPDHNTRNIIATRLSKDVNDLKESDIEEFVKSSICKALVREA